MQEPCTHDGNTESMAELKQQDCATHACLCHAASRWAPRVGTCGAGTVMEAAAMAMDSACMLGHTDCMRARGWGGTGRHARTVMEVSMVMESA